MVTIVDGRSNQNTSQIANTMDLQALDVQEKLVSGQDKLESE